MIKPQIIIEGNFSPKDIIASVTQEKFNLPKNIRNEIDDIWNKKIYEAKNNKLNLYNGNTYRLKSVKQQESNIVFEFQVMKFKDRFGLREIHRRYGISKELHRKGCFVSATVKTLDKKFVMVRLSGKSMNMNSIEVLGGIMEDNIQMSNTYIFDVLYLEIEEEIGVTKEEIKSMSLRAIFQGGYTNVGFYFEVDLNLSSTEILQRFKENRDYDIAGIEIFNYKEYLNILKNHNLNKQLIYKLVKKHH
ncbi:hypothetical protein CL684_03080 [Candidatus Campbellbacteria bacterium]|nr:hypothetical protein [Candidatus Campbellbacteria bacterium]|tara:strand:- start:118 stop:858 length:741 start_codon:yes stop_codon:yes gene_type:complete